MIKRYGVIAGIHKTLYAHLFRGSSATHMHDAELSLKFIQEQTRHCTVGTLLKHYIRPSKQQVKNAYTRVFDEIADIKQPLEPNEPLKDPEPQKEPKRKETEDPTDSYISLLRDGLITKAEFIKIMSNNNSNQPSYIY